MLSLPLDSISIDSQRIKSSWYHFRYDLSFWIYLTKSKRRIACLPIGLHVGLLYLLRLRLRLQPLCLVRFCLFLTMISLFLLLLFFLPLYIHRLLIFRVVVLRCKVLALRLHKTIRET